MKSSNHNQLSLTSFILPTPKEFDFKQNLDYLARDHQEIMYLVTESSISRRISLGSQDFLVELTQEQNDSLRVQFLGEYMPKTTTELNFVTDYIREWFDLDRDLSPFYSLAKKDAYLKESLTLFYGLRLIGIPNFFEALVWGILGQQINLTYAYQLKQRFVETYGDAIIFNKKTYWKFPDPQLISRFTPKEITETLGITVRKGEYLAELAQHFASEKLKKEDFKGLSSLTSAEKMLTNYRGIGPWTANYVLMRSLRYPDAFPTADVGLQRAVQTVANLPQKASEEYLRRLSKNWTGWQAYATFYLWRLLY